jgi:hypothetical protein
MIYQELCEKDRPIDKTLEKRYVILLGTKISNSFQQIKDEIIVVSDSSLSKF